MKDNNNFWGLYFGIGIIVLGIFLGMLGLQHRIEAIEHKMEMHGWRPQ